MEVLTGDESLTRWRRFFVRAIYVTIGMSFPLFLLSAGAALYWGWVRSDLQSALPYTPWARNSGMLAMCGAAAAFVVMFSPHRFPLAPKARLRLSLLATVTVALFAEFRNEGKFFLKQAVHFFGPGTWAREAFNQLFASLGDFLYRVEYSHWNDFLMGPAIVCVLFPLVYWRIHGSVESSSPLFSLGNTISGRSSELEQALRFARIIMFVGLFWFFLSAWAEKAGYVRNPHSRDMLDLPAEFGGTMLGFWMARYLTRPFGALSENFRSTLAIDFLCSGVIGLLYTVVVSTVTENISSSIAHSIFPEVPAVLEVSQNTVMEQRLRPVELLVLAGVMAWILNLTLRHEAHTTLSSGESEAASSWRIPMVIAKAFGAAAVCVLLWAAIIHILQEQGVDNPLELATIGIGTGLAGATISRRLQQRKLTTLSGEEPHP